MMPKMPTKKTKTGQDGIKERAKRIREGTDAVNREVNRRMEAGEPSILEEQDRIREVIEGEIIKKHHGNLKYDSKLANMLPELGSKGLTIAECCVELGLKCRTSWYEWKKNYPEFKAAVSEYELRLRAHREMVTRAYYSGTAPREGKWDAMKFVLQTQYRDDYTISQPNTEINIGSINSIDNMSLEELDKKIADSKKKIAKLQPQPKDDTEQAS